MYFWNTHKLAHRLQTHAVHDIDKVAYFLIFLGQLIFRITSFNCIPVLYHSLFHYVQHQLAITVEHPNLRFMVYHTVDHIFPILLLILCIVMLIWLYKTYGKNGAPHFVERIVCLNWPISVRIMLITSITFLLAAACAGFYFTSKLMMLTQAPEVKRNLVGNFFHIIGKIKVVGKIWESLKTLKQAEAIFVQMNQYSWYFYWSSQGLALISTVWYFCAMKKYLSKGR